MRSSCTDIHFYLTQVYCTSCHRPIRKSHACRQGGQGWRTRRCDPERCCGILPNSFQHTAKSHELLGPGGQPPVCAERNHFGPEIAQAEASFLESAFFRE